MESQIFRRILLCGLCQMSVARAEYRAFELKISDASTGSARVVLSNLDENQYYGYYHLALNEKLERVSTWMCRGRTNDQDICPNPKAQPETPPDAPPASPAAPANTP